jgi:hypothetical protein
MGRAWHDTSQRVMLGPPLSPVRRLAWARGRRGPSQHDGWHRPLEAWPSLALPCLYIHTSSPAHRALKNLIRVTAPAHHAATQTLNLIPSARQSTPTTSSVLSNPHLF